jgi:signal transduction histidine kinase
MLCCCCVGPRGLLLERVRVLVASKERLVYALSHELRAPINGMIGAQHDTISFIYSVVVCFAG